MTDTKTAYTITANSTSYGTYEDDLCASVFMSGGEVHAERYEVDTYVPKAYRA